MVFFFFFFFWWFSVNKITEEWNFVILEVTNDAFFIETNEMTKLNKVKT